VLERNEHADVAGGGVYGPDEGDQHDDGDVAGLRESDPGRDHQERPGKEKAAQRVAGAEESDREREHRRSEQGRRRHDADPDRIEPDGGQVGRQNDDGEAVAESADSPRRIEEGDVERAPLRLDHAVPAPSSARRSIACGRLGAFVTRHVSLQAERDNTWLRGS
jgi:hypothetical protein